MLVFPLLDTHGGRGCARREREMEEAKGGCSHDLPKSRSTSFPVALRTVDPLPFARDRRRDDASFLTLFQPRLGRIFF